MTGSPTGCYVRSVFSRTIRVSGGYDGWSILVLEVRGCVPNSTPRLSPHLADTTRAIFVFSVALMGPCIQPLSAGSSPHPHLQVCMSFRSRLLSRPRRSPTRWQDLVPLSTSVPDVATAVRIAQNKRSAPPRPGAATWVQSYRPRFVNVWLTFTVTSSVSIIVPPSEALTIKVSDGHQA